MGQGQRTNMEDQLIDLGSQTNTMTPFKNDYNLFLFNPHNNPTKYSYHR